MGQIRFSLAQIEAFASVCESGNLTRAAARLGKDRTTVSELIDYLELDLGYPLFDRTTRPLQLTEAGHRLYRQARMFLQEAEAFSLMAARIPQQVRQSLTLCYDPFIPRDFLNRLAAELQMQNVRFNLIMMDRGRAERALEEGLADLAIYQALNRSISDKFKWRAIGSIELSAYASEGFFPDKSPVSMLRLTASNQLIPFADLPEHMAKRLQISDNVQVINELSQLQALLSGGFGWGLLPTHLQADSWPGVKMIETELGQHGLIHPMVILWKPGISQELLQIVDQIQQIY